MLKLDIKRYKMIEVYIFCLLLSFNITNLVVIPIGNRSVHIHHIITFFFCVWTCFHFKKFKLKMNMLILYYFFALFVSIIVAFKYGIGSTFVNVIYCLILFLLVSTWSEDIDIERIYKIIQYVGYILMAASTINLLIQWDKVLYSFDVKAAHLLVETLVAGGANIEATFLATYACFFLYQKKYSLWVFSLFIAILYSSRVAIVLNIISLTLYLFYFLKNADRRRGDSTTRKKMFALVIIFFALLITMYYKEYFNHIIYRFSNIGKDVGSLHRIQLWTNALDVFKSNPFGVGIGNAITCANELNENPIPLENIHCVYLQVLVETGVIGFILFLLSIYQVVKKAFMESFSDPLGAMLLGYFFCCFLQFRGTEPLYITLWAFFLLKEYPVGKKLNEG